MAGEVFATNLAESFEGAEFPPPGWIIRNQSTLPGEVEECWRQLPGEPWPAIDGGLQASANYNCVLRTLPQPDISGWLITPRIDDLTNGRELTFWTKGSTLDADRLEIRLCVETSPDSCGAGSTGTTVADVGQFTRLLVTINPNLEPGGYPGEYTFFSVPIADLPAGQHTGRFAFRYFVPDSETNSRIITPDDVHYQTPFVFSDGFEGQ